MSQNNVSTVNSVSIGDTVKFNRNPVGTVVDVTDSMLTIRTKKGQMIYSHISFTNSGKLLPCKKVLVEKVLKIFSNLKK